MSFRTTSAYTKSSHTKKFILICIVALILVFSLLFGKFLTTHRLSFEKKPLSESTAVLTKPYCGFFHLYGYQLSETPVKEVINWCNQMLANDTQSIVLLQINLCNYSNSPVSAHALRQLDSIFKTFSNAKKQIILRFLYDWEGNALKTEPDSLNQSLSHMEQVAPVVNRYKQSIFLLQSVFTGNCGEMNQTHYGTNENIIQLMEKFADVTSPEIFLSVRTPAHLRTITKTATPLSAKIAYNGSLAARLGLFNDGMFGNAFDCGTYDDTSFAGISDYTQKGTRKEEIDFQDKLCYFVPNGGEAVLDNSYNDLPNAISDLNRMHVSYLSCDHDASVLNKWKRVTYAGNENDIFNGVSGYDYIAAHLGYRYVLRQVDIQKTSGSSMTTPDITITATLENTGFSPAYRKFQIAFLLKSTVDSSSDNTISIPVSYDNRKLLSGQSAELIAQKSLSDIPKGEYTVSISITDKATKLSVPLANGGLQKDNTVSCGKLRIP